MISVIVLTKNEEENIGRCLNSVLWADEIIVVDDESTDKTVEIAKSLGASVIKHSLNNNFSQQRNFALSLAKHEWALFLDADEEISSKLKEEIVLSLNQNHDNTAGYFFKRDDFFAGKWLKHGETGNIKLLRLAKKESGRWERNVDEIWKVSGKSEIFKNHLKHYSHLSLVQFLESINHRSTLNALEFFNIGKKLNLFEWFKPFLKFIQNYFIRLGFLDGVFGFVFAVLMSLHSFMVRAKLYLLWRKK
jgi:glycosyltransferase involved in cell wall biosynthesis